MEHRLPNNCSYFFSLICTFLTISLSPRFVPNGSEIRKSKYCIIHNLQLSSDTFMFCLYSNPPLFHLLSLKVVSKVIQFFALPIQKFLRTFLSRPIMQSLPSSDGIHPRPTALRKTISLAFVNAIQDSLFLILKLNTFLSLGLRFRETEAEGQRGVLWCRSIAQAGQLFLR